MSRAPCVRGLLAALMALLAMIVSTPAHVLEPARHADADRMLVASQAAHSRTAALDHRASSHSCASHCASHSPGHPAPTPAALAAPSADPEWRIEADLRGPLARSKAPEPPPRA